MYARGGLTGEAALQWPAVLSLVVVLRCAGQSVRKADRAYGQWDWWEMRQVIGDTG